MRNLIAVAVLAVIQVSAFAGLERRVEVATDVVINRMTSKNPIPKYVMDEARCLAVLKVVKVGFIWGGEGSTGIALCRTEDGGWSEPSFFNTGGVSFGLQIGVQFFESVLVFITDKARQVLTRTTFQMGADLSFAAGPVGAGSGVGAIPNAEVLSYQRTVGLFAGASINGFVLTHDDSANQKAYGEKVTPKALLSTDIAKSPAIFQPFTDSVKKYF